MIVDQPRCEKKARERHEPLPFAPLVLSDWVSYFLLGSCVGAWPCLGAGPLGRLGRLEREVRTWVTGSSWRGERSKDVWERGHCDGDKQCYIMGHIYVSSHASSVGDSCLATGASQSGSLRDLSGS